MKFNLAKFFIMLTTFSLVPTFVMAKDCSPEEYLNRRPDVRAAGVDVFEHYNQHGIKEGMCRPVSKECTPEEYLRRRPDVAAAGMDPVDHYNNHGVNEGMCDPSDEEIDIPENPELPENPENPELPENPENPEDPRILGEGECTPDEYLDARPDVRDAGITAVDHYNNHGIKEGMCKPIPGGIRPVPETSEEAARSIPRGRWAYIDDMVQTLKTQYPGFWRRECQFSGDTNAPQDWVATILLAAEYNSLPLFMGASATGCKDAPKPSQSQAGKELGESLSMGIPVYAGSPTLGNHSQSALSKRIVEEASKGKFTLVVGGPFTDIYAALKAKPSIASNLYVYGIGPSNGPADQVAFDQMTKILGSHLYIIKNRDYIKLITGKYKVSKPAWIDSLRSVPEWDTVNTADVLAQNTWHNRGYAPEAKGFRLADVILTNWYFSKSLSQSLDVNRVLPIIERGAKRLKIKPPVVNPEVPVPDPEEPPVIDNREKCTPAEYLRRRPDVKAAGVDPVDHYKGSGKNEGMCNPVATSDTPVVTPEPEDLGPAPHGKCSTPKYFTLRPDVLNAIKQSYVGSNIVRTDQTDFERALKHFKNAGINENMCQPQAPGFVDPAPEPEPEIPVPTGPVEDASAGFDINKVKWLHTNVKNWKVTSKITSTRVSTKEICISHSKGGKWKVGYPLGHGVKLEGNPWVFVKINGQVYAATYEWLRPGQVCKLGGAKNALAAIGPHTKQSPIKEWVPRSGEVVGFMISGFARSGYRNVQERSDIKFVKIP